MPLSRRGSVRTTGVVRAGISRTTDRTSSGGVTLTRQSAPTCACAASSWFRSTMARYEVETTRSPIESSSSRAAANPVPGERPIRLPAR